MADITSQKRRIAPFALGLLVAAALAVPACTKKNTRVLFNGNYFPAKSSAVKDDRQSFVVRVQRIERGLDGAREAARYEATRYCIENFGTSEIEWIRGPDAEDGTLDISGSTLVVSGTCVLW